MNFGDAQKEARERGTAKVKKDRPKLRKLAIRTAIIVTGIAFIVHLSLKLLTLDDVTQEVAESKNNGTAASPQTVIALVPRTGKAIAPVGKRGEWVNVVVGEDCLYTDDVDANIYTVERGREMQSRHVRKGELRKTGLQKFAFQSNTTAPIEIGWTLYPPGFRYGEKVMCPAN